MKEELPETIALANGARLTLSSKKDCYYYVSEKGCTCKAGRMAGSAGIGATFAKLPEKHRMHEATRPKLSSDP